MKYLAYFENMKKISSSLQAYVWLWTNWFSGFKRKKFLPYLYK